MNTLSIFLYLANVIPNLAAVLIGTAIATGIVLAIFVIAKAINNDVEGIRPGNQGYVSPFYYNNWLWLVAFCSVLAAIIPSERTMYMIAASELGEVAVMNEEVREVFDALKDRILIELRPQENTNN